jgi:hypothetical protein
MKLASEELNRAEAIAIVESGGARSVLERIAALPEKDAATAEWQYVKGLAYAYLGITASAVSIWEPLFADGLWSEKLVTELARAYLTLSRPADAEALIDTWHEEEGGEVASGLQEVWAESLLAQQDSAKAEKVLSRAARYPKRKSNIGHTAMTRAKVLSGDWQALTQDLDSEQAESGLKQVAEMLQRNAALTESAMVLEYLIAAKQDDVDVRTALARVKWQLGEENEAMNMLADAHEKFADSPVLLEAIARTCLDDCSYELAGAWVTQLEEKLGSEDPVVQALSAEVMLGLGDLQSVRELISASPQVDDGLDAARVAFYSRINVPDRAIYYQDRLLQGSQRSTEMLLASARLASSAGRAKEAVGIAQEALAGAPGSLGASALLVAHQGRDAELGHLQRLRNALLCGRLPPRQQAWLNHCLAEYCHATGDFDMAAQLYGRCNSLSEPGPEERYSAGKHRGWLRELATTFSSFETPTCGGNSQGESESEPASAAQPVFVVGVPRSGTTLTEQILARHPRATGMGECQHVSLSLNWLRQPDAGAQAPLPLSQALSQCTPEQLQDIRGRFLRLLSPHAGGEDETAGHVFIDKMPDNYSLVGWIFTLFPHARVIYARRDPREIALSCWKANFGAINWAYRMEDIADRIVQHHNIMKLWLEKFGDRIFVSNYADLVSEPEQQTREMLAYLGLDWDAACSDHTRAASVVRTASVNQVRKPVYKTSLSAWKFYETLLAPAIAVFEHNELL